MIVISGPSGAGKSTVVRGLLTGCSLPLALSVSATTRPPRQGEVHGKDYFFLPADEFDRRRRAGEVDRTCPPIGSRREMQLLGIESAESNESFRLS